LPAVNRCYIPLKGEARAFPDLHLVTVQGEWDKFARGASRRPAVSDINRFPQQLGQTLAVSRGVIIQKGQ
jgi:hypothetical protein